MNENISRANENEQESIPATPLQPAVPTRPPVPPCPPPPMPPCPPPPRPCPPCDSHPWPQPVPPHGPIPPACPPDPYPPCPPEPCYPSGRRKRPLWCGPVDTTKPGDFYNVSVPCKNPIPPEGYDIAPLVPYVPGTSVEKQMEYLYSRMNQLIAIFTECNDKVFGAYQAVVNSATCNNAYYNEITMEQGYFPESQVAYKVTHIPFIDCTGNPIYLELGLPNNSTINDGGTENCYSASRRTLADKLIPATQSGEKWQGWVMWKGRQVNAPQPPIITEKQENPPYYIFGVSENGYLKWYPADVSIRTLNVEKIRNAMNCSAVLVNQKQATPELFSPVGTQHLARTAIGMNYDTKERFIIQVDGSEQTGCTEAELADIFVRYGCNVAVQVAYSTSSFAMDKGLMEFEPATVDSDQTPTMPAVSGFWYITKRRHYHNAFVKEIALLTQMMGEQIWYDWVNADSIDYVKDRIREVYAKLLQEITDRTDGDEHLQEQIDALVGADILEVTSTLAGTTKRIYTIKRKDGTEVSVPIVTYDYEQLSLQLGQIASVEGRLNEEIQARIEGDMKNAADLQKVINDLTAEVAARIKGDQDIMNYLSDQSNPIYTYINQVQSTLNTSIAMEKAERMAADDGLNTQIANFKLEYNTFVGTTNTEISNLKTSISDLETSVNAEIATIKGNINDINDTLNQHTTDITTLQGQYNDLTTRMSSLNSAVTALQSAFNNLETSFDNIKTAFSELQQNFTNLSNEFDQLKADMQGIEDAIKQKIENGPWLNQITISAPDGQLTRRMRPDANGVFFTMPGDDSQDSLAEVKVGTAQTQSSAVPLEQVENMDVQAIADAHNYTDVEIKKIQEQIGDLAYLSVTGGMMSGDINMVDHYIKNLPDPEDDGDAANKSYVDLKVGIAGDGKFLPLSGGTMAGDINSDGNTVTGLKNPENPTDAVNLQYLQEHSTDNALPLAGGTMSGDIDMDGNVVTGLPTTEPENVGDAISKGYLDSIIGEGVVQWGDSSIVYEKSGSHDETNYVYTPPSDGVLIGKLTTTQNNASDGTVYVLIRRISDNVVLGSERATFHDYGTTTVPVKSGVDYRITSFANNTYTSVTVFFIPYKNLVTIPKSELLGEAQVKWDSRISVVTADETRGATGSTFIKNYTPTSDGVFVLCGISFVNSLCSLAFAGVKELPTNMDLGSLQFNSADFDQTATIPAKQGISYQIITQVVDTANKTDVFVYYVPYKQIVSVPKTEILADAQINFDNYTTVSAYHVYTQVESFVWKAPKTGTLTIILDINTLSPNTVLSAVVNKNNSLGALLGSGSVYEKGSETYTIPVNKGENYYVIFTSDGTPAAGHVGAWFDGYSDMVTLMPSGLKFLPEQIIVNSMTNVPAPFATDGTLQHMSYTPTTSGFLCGYCSGDISEQKWVSLFTANNSSGITVINDEVIGANNIPFCYPVNANESYTLNFGLNDSDAVVQAWFRPLKL